MQSDSAQAWSDIVLHRQEFLYSGRCLTEDTKNYHAWAHRAAIAEAFDSWERELPIITKMLSEDARNNSAWNHKFLTIQHLLGRQAARLRLHFIASVIPPAGTRRCSRSLQMYTPLYRGTCVQHGRAGMGRQRIMQLKLWDAVNRNSAEALLDDEMKALEIIIMRAPHNESAWQYLRGLCSMAYHKPCQPSLQGLCLKVMLKQEACISIGWHCAQPPGLLLRAVPAMCDSDKD